MDGTPPFGAYEAQLPVEPDADVLEPIHLVDDGPCFVEGQFVHGMVLKSW